MASQKINNQGTAASETAGWASRFAQIRHGFYISWAVTVPLLILVAFLVPLPDWASDALLVVGAGMLAAVMTWRLENWGS